MKHRIVIMGLAVLCCLGCSGGEGEGIPLSYGYAGIGVGGAAEPLERPSEGVGGSAVEPIKDQPIVVKAGGGSGGAIELLGTGGVEPQGSVGGAPVEGSGGAVEPMGTGGAVEPSGMGGTIGVGGDMGSGGEGTGGEPMGSGGISGVGGAPVCVPDVTMCNDVSVICGVIPDGCGGELNCGGCQPSGVAASWGNVCEFNVCEQVDLPPSDTRVPGHDAQCVSAHGAGYGEAWRGFGSGTSCTSLTGTDLLCCEPAEPCHALEVTGCSEKLFNCANPNRSECTQLTYNGRLKNEWCCE